MCHCQPSPSHMQTRPWMAYLGHRESWHPIDTRPLSGKENPGGKQGPGLFCREGEATGAWEWTGNSNTRFILEKMLGTHICSERGESRACRALDWSPSTPGNLGNGLVACQLAPLAAPTPQSKALGSDKGLQQGTSQQEQRLYLQKAEDQEVLAAVFHIWKGRCRQTGKKLPERDPESET